MTLSDLITRTKQYVRDSNGYMFTDNNTILYINEGIDRLRQYKLFKDMEYLVDEDDVPAIIPSSYHYMLALFSASRLYDIDERFFEGTQKRNEFEQLFSELISGIETGEVEIEGIDALDAWCDDAVQDKYFTTSSGDTEGGL